MENCYTYTFWDGDKPIYVGKGTGNRAFDHLKRTDFHPFVHKLRKMKREGREPTVRAITGLTEQRAFMAEKLLIGVFGRRDLGTGTLLNLTPGGESPPKLFGDKNPMKRPEIAALFTGDRNPMKRPEVAAKLSGDLCSMRRPEVAAKVVAARRANGSYKQSKESRKKTSDTLKAKGIKPPLVRDESFFKTTEYKNKMSNSITLWWAKRKKQQEAEQVTLTQQL